MIYFKKIHKLFLLISLLLSNNIFSQNENYISVNNITEYKDLKKIIKKDTIKTLKIRDIERVPDDIFEFKNITELDLSYNNLSKDSLLFNKLSSLKNLKNLKLNRCFNGKIPQNIYRITSLKSLSLSENFFNEIPDDIFELKNLEYLIFDNLGDWGHTNSISQLPNKISNLEQLKGINLNNNKIVNFPYEFSLLRNLEIVALSNNKISEFPRSFFKLLKLKRIDLSDNKLSYLPDSIFILKNLRSLSLSGNNIKELPDSFYLLDSLKSLSLNRNQFERFPIKLIKMKSLEILYIDFERFEYISEDLSPNENLYIFRFICPKCEDNITQNLQKLFPNAKIVREFD